MATSWLKKVFVWLVVLLMVIGQAASAQDSGVSDERFARLARGVNLMGWFWYAPETEEGIRGRFKDEDFELMRDLGLTFARVPIDLNFLLDENRDNLLNLDRLALLDEGIQRLLDHDLGVVVDLHSTSLADSDAANYSGALEDPAFVEVFVRFWESFAAHLTSTIRIGCSSAR